MDHPSVAKWSSELKRLETSLSLWESRALTCSNNFPISRIVFAMQIRMRSLSTATKPSPGLRARLSQRESDVFYEF
jgi:hypothetical protein